jgi:tetratricopeptide (TPR) repeat protein
LHRACIEQKTGYQYQFTMRSRLLALISVFVFGGALHAVDNPLANYPAEYAKLLRDAMRSFSERDFATAVALIDKADTIHAPTATSLNVRGAVAIEEHRFEEGRNLCIEALKLDPKFFPARFNLAEIPFVKGNYGEARNIFQRLEEEHPRDELLQFRIYLTYLLEKNDAAAKAALDQVPFLSNTPIYYYSYGAWEFAHGNSKGGKEWIERGNWVFPPFKTRNYADVFFDLGWLPRPGVIHSSGVSEPAQSAEAAASSTTAAPPEPAVTKTP